MAGLASRIRRIGGRGRKGRTAPHWAGMRWLQGYTDPLEICRRFVANWAAAGRPQIELLSDPGKALADHHLHRLVAREPQPGVNAWVFWYSLVSDLLDTDGEGRAFAWIRRSRGSVTELVYLDARFMTLDPRPGDRDRIVWRYVDGNGTPFFFQEKDLIALRWSPKGRLDGETPGQASRRVRERYTALDDSAKAMTEQRPHVVWKTRNSDPLVQDEMAKKLREDDIAFTQEGEEIQFQAIDPGSSLLVEAEKHLIARSSAVMQCPPLVQGDYRGAYRRPIEMAEHMNTYTFRPLQRQIALELDVKLRLREQGLRAGWNWAGSHRQMSFQEAAGAGLRLLDAGVITRAELRVRAGFDAAGGVEA